MMFVNKKSISPVVATALLLVVAVISVVSFQDFVGEFNSDAFSKVETSNSKNADLKLSGIIGNILYIQSKTNVSLNVFKIVDSNGDIVCSYSNSNNSDEKDLRGYWSFDDYNSTHVFDSSVFNNSAEFIKIDSSYITSGIFNTALDFANIGRVQTEVSEAFTIVNEGSISLWANPARNNTAGLLDCLLTKGNANWDRIDYSLHIINNFFFGNLANGTHSLASSGPKGYITESNKWYYLTFTWNTSLELTKMYLNGVNTQDKSTTIIPRDVVSSIAIGGDNNYNDYYFSGLIDEVRLFNRTLSQEDISNLYYFNRVGMDLDSGVNEINVFGCELERGKVYNVVAFGRNAQINSKVMVK